MLFHNASHDGCTNRHQIIQSGVVGTSVPPEITIKELRMGCGSHEELQQIERLEFVSQSEGFA